MAVRAALLLTCLAAAGKASVIVSPTVLFHSMGELGSNIVEHAFNGTGLSTGFTSGVTDYDAYLALNPTHGNSTSAGIRFIGTAATGTINLDFGSAPVPFLTHFVIWTGTDFSIDDFEILASPDSSFIPASLTSMGIYSVTGTAAPFTHQEFEFDTKLQTRYIQLRIISSISGFTGVAELAFKDDPTGGGPSVPEPSSVLLLGVGAAAWLLYRRRR